MGGPSTPCGWAAGVEDLRVQCWAALSTWVAGCCVGASSLCATWSKDSRFVAAAACPDHGCCVTPVAAQGGAGSCHAAAERRQHDRAGRGVEADAHRRCRQVPRKPTAGEGRGGCAQACVSLCAWRVSEVLNGHRCRGGGTWAAHALAVCLSCPACLLDQDTTLLSPATCVCVTHPWFCCCAGGNREPCPHL